MDEVQLQSALQLDTVGPIESGRIELYVVLKKTCLYHSSLCLHKISPPSDIIMASPPFLLPPSIPLPSRHPSSLFPPSLSQFLPPSIPPSLYSSLPLLPPSLPPPPILPPPPSSLPPSLQLNTHPSANGTLTPAKLTEGQ